MHTILRLPQVKKSTGLARSTIYKKMAERTFPQAIALGEKAVGWLEQDIQRWIEERIAQSQTATAQE